MSKNLRASIKTLHLLSACLWLGTATSLVMLQLLKGWSDNGAQLRMLNESFSILDLGLIIPGAIGSALTGYIICRNTSWGFTRYWWIILKGSLTLMLILIGTVCLGPWQMKMVELSGHAIQGASYDRIRSLFTGVGMLQVLMLMAIVTLSALKPWGKRMSKPMESEAVHSQAKAPA